MSALMATPSSVEKYLYLSGTPLQTPPAIQSDPMVESSIVRQYKILSATEDAKDFFSLSKEEQQDVLKRLNRVFREVEATCPAAGYKVRFVGSNAGKNPMEVYLYAFDTRERETEMAMTNNCVFCNKIDLENQMEECAEEKESSARIIKSLQGNALVVSTIHKGNFFVNELSEQHQMLLAAWKVIDTAKVGFYNYEIHFHCGVEGHQAIPHSHAHLLTGTNIAFAHMAKRPPPRELSLHSSRDLRKE